MLLPQVFIVLSFSYFIIFVSYYDGVIKKTSDVLVQLSGPLRSAVALGSLGDTSWPETTVLSATTHSSVLSDCMDTLSFHHHTHVSLFSSMGIGDENGGSLSENSLCRMRTVRVLVVGSLIKWMMGLFPTTFAWGNSFQARCLVYQQYSYWAFKTTTSIPSMYPSCSFGISQALPLFFPLDF